MSKKAGTYYYYMCYSRDGNKEMKKTDFCKNPNYREDVLDGIITREILELCVNPDKIDKMKQGQNKLSDERPIIIKSRIVEIDKQMNKLIDLYQIGTIPLTEISSRTDPLQKERDQLERQLNHLSIENTPVISVDEAKVIINTAHSVFDNGSDEEKRSFVNSLISKILILNNGLKIYWKFLV
jgi:site-specific DNA recombinase